MSGDAGGALAPAGDNRFKVWSTSSPETARALAAGEVPPVLDMFLYESSQNAIEEKAGKTILGVINSGGTIAWIIVALGALGGIGAGIWMGKSLSGIYTEFYSLPFLIYVLKPGVVAAAVLISMLVAVLGTLHAVTSAARQPPAQAMRPEPPLPVRSVTS